MNSEIKQIIKHLYNNEVEAIDKQFKTDIIFYHNTDNYKEIWIKPNYQNQGKGIFNYYWFHLYEYIGEFEEPHLLLIRGKMGNTTEKKIYFKEVE